MTTLYRYRVFCSTSAQYEYVWLPAGDPAPTTCPADPAHTIDGAQTAVVDTVSSQDVVVIQPTNADGIPFSIPKASGVGYILNDRDVLLRTSIVDQALAVEDLKVAPSDHAQTTWGETSLVGVYKRSDVNVPYGAHVLCADQADADANATLSVYDYQAKTGGNPVSYEIRGGSIYIDLHVEGLGANATEREAHRIYVVAAPDIPLAFGGQIAFFDGYLAPWAQKWLKTDNNDAFRVVYNPAAPPASILRTWIFYPPGMKRTHILRFTLYRQQTT
jgi:hypothetical protein